MPKKGKKGGGKGKKGKKGKKAKDNSPLKMAARNTSLWEARITMMDNSRQQYRDRTENLATENETLRDQMRQTEKDTLDVVSILKKQDLDKDTELERLHEEVRSLQVEHRKDREDLIDDFTRQKRQVNEKLAKKEGDLEIIRHELNQVKEFRKKKAQMQEELEEIKEAMLWNQREHKESLERLEQKFSNEKLRLQQESNNKIAEIAEHAQNEALKTLDDKTRNIYKENVDLNESLRIYKQEFDTLQKSKSQLTKQATAINNDKEMNDLLIKEKIEQVQKQNKLIKELKEKIQYLETSLTQFIGEFNTERKKLMDQSQIEHQSSHNELIKLQRALELKSKEMNKVKKLGKTILEQRTELEIFFSDALQNVKRQIVYNRLQSQKDAFNTYQNRMLNTQQGQGEQAKIRSLNEAFQEFNTQDLEETSRQTNLAAEVEITDLTWEQKEQVLRELFIRMNTRSSSMTDSTTNAAHLPNDGHSIDHHHRNNDDNTTNRFLTHPTQNESLSISSNNTSTSTVPKLPQITSTPNT